MSEGRTIEQRKTDVVAALSAGRDGWMATASRTGRPHLIPVSCWWDGEAIMVTTVGTSRSAKNLAGNGEARLALGSPDDVVVIDATVVDRVPVLAAPPELAEGFVRGVGWDPREMGGAWEFFKLRPSRVQAYRGYDELDGRDVMGEGLWLA
jgi:Pyridoxamine 5'-phosphate oxidase